MTASYIPVGLNAPVAVTGHDYEITFDGSSNEYHVRNLTTGQDLSPIPNNSQPINVDGMNLHFTGAPQPGDTWSLLSTRNAARDLKLALNKPEQIAVANSDGGLSNGENALLLAGLQNKRLFDSSTASMTELYAGTVNILGVQAKAALTSQDAQAKLVTQKRAAQQSVSGVNANEEYTNLVQYQAMYQAAAKVINTATTLFDTLLSLKS